MSVLHLLCEDGVGQEPAAGDLVFRTLTDLREADLLRGGCGAPPALEAVALLRASQRHIPRGRARSRTPFALPWIGLDLLDRAR